MNTASTIIKSLILPLVIKFSKGNINTLPDDYWNQFAADFVHFENDATPVYTALYQLELQNPEDVFEKLPEAYSSFIKELAEEFVLGHQSEITAQLLEIKNETFLEEVKFLKTMKAVITKVEREELKKNLPTFYDRLVFELDVETLKQVAKKKSREDLRDKFKLWDEELVSSEDVLVEANYSLNLAFEESTAENQNEKPKSKLISLNWIKYAVAASVLLIAGFLYFYESSTTIKPITQPKEDKIVTTEDIEIEEVILDDITTVSRSLKVLEEVGLGYATSSKEITINIINQEARKLSTTKAINANKNILEDEYKRNKIGEGSRVKALKIQYDSLQNELTLLNELEKQYVFDGKTLTIYDSSFSNENRVFLYENSYYLEKGKDFYKLAVANQLQFYKKETNPEVLKALEKIIFDNE